MMIKMDILLLSEVSTSESSEEDDVIDVSCEGDNEIESRDVPSSSSVATDNQTPVKVCYTY